MFYPSLKKKKPNLKNQSFALHLPFTPKFLSPVARYLLQSNLMATVKSFFFTVLRILGNDHEYPLYCKEVCWLPHGKVLKELSNFVSWFGLLKTEYKNKLDLDPNLQITVSQSVKTIF